MALHILDLTRLLFLSFLIVVSLMKRLVDSLALLQLTLCIAMKDLICDQVFLVVILFIIVERFDTVVFLLLLNRKMPHCFRCKKMKSVKL